MPDDLFEGNKPRYEVKALDFFGQVVARGHGDGDVVTLVIPRNCTVVSIRCTFMVRDEPVMLSTSMDRQMAAGDMLQVRVRRT